MSDSSSSGRGRTRTVSTDDVLDAFVEVDAPVASATMLAECLESSRSTVLRRLRELHDEGDVGRLEVGARAVVWWPA